ncbi:MAG: hypothetical protein ABIK15_14905 [Pseudomonadota bacterium]
MKPLRQGDLDGLCGIYSIVNALRLVCNLNNDECFVLFKESLALLEKKKKLSEIIAFGTSIVQLSRVFKEVIDEKYPTKRTKPFHKNKDVPLCEYWNALEEFLVESNRAVIIGIDGDEWDGHWTCVVTVTEKTLVLFDSYNWKRLYRKNYTTRKITKRRPYLISPYYTIFISKKE